ncbi:hypothetical protein Q4534_18425 [Cyclobacterium sp. 1_MG-2023]|nr:hypothetical protein [Cyclobacterium sp. 1_MG-2023]MDO6439407.1 hypothetical protein [Cyclobacterium sp. 1_MG-2023]
MYKESLEEPLTKGAMGMSLTTNMRTNFNDPFERKIGYFLL